jgi:outer membrane assembly lipoprotein YfiO
MRRFFVVGFLGLAACHHAAARPHALPTPESMLEHARTLYRHGEFAKALLAYQRMLFELGPTDSSAAEVHYYLAESYFQTGDRVQAAHEFRQTADQFPQSAYAPPALLRAGDSNLRLWRRPDLDPSYGETALAIYQELAGRYPQSDAAQRAQFHVRQLREWFADKAYRNGLFYYRRHAYDSGIIYFKDVIANYGETPRAADAMLRLADSYRAIHYTEELQEACDRLRRYYPKLPGVTRSCPAPDGAPPAGRTAPTATP